VHVAGVGEEAGGAPQELDPRASLLLLGDGHHGVEVAVRLGQGLALGREVAVVEGPELDAELLEELEGGPYPPLGVLDGLGAVIPRPHHGADAELIGARAPERVPEGDGEAEVIRHGHAGDDLIGVVVPEGEGVLGPRPLEPYLGHIGESFSHANHSLSV